MKKCTKTGKTAFEKESTAKSELAFCRMAYFNGNEKYTQIRYYKCEFCNHYHLTSKEDRFKKESTDNQPTRTEV